MLLDGRRAARTALVLMAIAAIAIPVVVARDALFGPGPTAIHDPRWLAPNIHVCGRDYKAGDAVVPRAWTGDSPFVLVEPAPLAGCSIAVEDPAGFCPAHPLACQTFTVVLVRVGEDAYVPYALRGGP
jgi:hypothetical protein